jgi:hypothetical protein
MRRLKNIFLASTVLGGLTASTTTLPRAIGMTTLISSPRNFYFIPRPSKKLNKVSQKKRRLKRRQTGK